MIDRSSSLEVAALHISLYLLAGGRYLCISLVKTDIVYIFYRIFFIIFIINVSILFMFLDCYLFSLFILLLCLLLCARTPRQILCMRKPTWR